MYHHTCLSRKQQQQAPHPCHHTHCHHTHHTHEEDHTHHTHEEGCCNHSHNPIFEHRSSPSPPSCRTTWFLLHGPLTEITPQLYISGINHLREDVLLEKGITHVLSLTKTLPLLTQKFLKKRFNHLHLPICDRKVDEFAKIVRPSLEFIDKAIKEENGIVLVHCFLGLSRSSAIVLAYLMKERYASFDEALKYLQECKPERDIMPHPSFVEYLQKKTISHIRKENSDNKS